MATTLHIPAQHHTGSPVMGIWVGSAGNRELLLPALEALQKHRFRGSLLLAGYIHADTLAWQEIKSACCPWFEEVNIVAAATPLNRRHLYLPHQPGYLLLQGEQVVPQRWPEMRQNAESDALLDFLQGLHRARAQSGVALLLGKPPELEVDRLLPLVATGLQLWESDSSTSLVRSSWQPEEEEISLGEMSRRVVRRQEPVQPQKETDLSPMARIRELEAQLERRKQENEQLHQRVQQQAEKINRLESTLNDALMLETEAQLAALSERLQLATESAQIGVWEWDPEQDQLIWNPQMFHIFGVDREVFHGTFRDWQLVVLPEDRPHAEASLQRTLQTGEPFEEVFRINRFGEVRYIQAVATLYRDAAGKPQRVIGVNWDTTQTKQAEQAMRLAREQAEEWARLKSNFMSNMSHEIRTPLNGVLGMATLAQGEKDLQVIKGMLQVIEDSGKRLLHTLTGILELALIESENAEFDFDEINLTQMLENGMAYWAPLGSQKGLKVQRQTPDRQYYIWGDLRMLTLVLDNLVGNALKFTQQGSITLSLQSLPPTGQPQWINIVIQDTGIGIEPDKLKKIFEAFSQASQGHARTHEGTGLGLAVAQKYTHLLGGKIAVESTQGLGTTFTIRLPLRKVE